MRIYGRDSAISGRRSITVSINPNVLASSAVM
jgi:hypothetical protein